MRRLILALLLTVAAQAQVVSFVSSPSATATSTLNNGLISFWKFDGNWNDSKSSNTLTPTNSPYVSATGKNGQAASFEADSSQYALRDDNADLSFSDTESFTIAYWYKPESSTQIHMMVVKATGADVGKYEYATFLNTANTVDFRVGNETNFSSVTTTETIPDGEWKFVCVWYNVATDSIYVQINNTTPIAVVATYGPRDGTANFTLGRIPSIFYADGLMDDLGVWGRSGNKTTGKAMADSIYNAGNGWRP